LICIAGEFCFFAKNPEKTLFHRTITESVDRSVQNVEYFMKLKNIGKMSAIVGIIQYKAITQQDGKHATTFIEV
jgi:hypothetical protein